MSVNRSPRLKADKEHVKGVVGLDRVEGNEGEGGIVAEANRVNGAVQAEDEGGKPQQTHQTVGGGALRVDHHGSGVLLNALENLLLDLMGNAIREIKKKKKKKKNPKQRDGHLGLVSANLDLMASNDIKRANSSLLDDLGIAGVEEIEDSWVASHGVVADHKAVGEVLFAGDLSHHLPDVHSRNNTDEVEQPEGRRAAQSEREKKMEEFRPGTGSTKAKVLTLCQTASMGDTALRAWQPDIRQPSK